MNKPSFTWILALATGAAISIVEDASAEALAAFPSNVSCQLSLNTPVSSNDLPIEEVARSCNEFKIQNELEFNLVKGACILGGVLYGSIYAFSEGVCDSGNASALCRVPVQSMGFDEVTWFFEPNTPNDDTPSHQEEFKASCDELGGKFEALSY